ncbi:transglutaminase family protein [Actinospongicola halichondriae]|uniref:transglutaminase family protein n=1 Tax=Actinospongicola halichondriae TaxID=3236844 RepID=UPI003D3FD73C
MEATERFADVVARDPVPLDEAAFLIGAHADPDCDVAAGLARLDALAESVAEPSLEALLAALFGTGAFVGDRATYYDARNSYLHAVLDRGRGIPITLAVLAMEVGRRVGVGLDGVGTPAHFVVRTRDPEVRFVDVFGGGRVLDRGDLDEMFRTLAPGIDIGPFLAPLAPLDIVRRILANLTNIHRRSGDRDALLWTTQLRTVVPGSTADDERIFGGALAATGDFARAAKVLESIVDGGRASDPERELAEARRLRARLN